MSSLAERLAESLRATAEQRARDLQAQAAEDQLALSQPLDPETIAMDEKSDRQVEEMLEADARELERAKFTASAVVELWIQSGSDARELALTALVHSLNLRRNTHAMAHRGTVVGFSGESEPLPEHLCIEPRLVCSTCLSDLRELLPEQASRAIVRLSQRGPLDGTTRLELGADQIVSTLMERAAAADPDSFNLGSLPSKLADLLREPTPEGA